MIYKYNQKAVQMLKTKTASEPWLHIGIADDTAVIFIWDTRQIVAIEPISGQYDTANLTPAKDNALPLKGDKDGWSAKLHFYEKGNVEAIKAALTTDNWNKRQFACLLACCQIYLYMTEDDEKKPKKTTISGKGIYVQKYNGIGFSGLHHQPMSAIARKLLEEKVWPTNDEIRYCCNVMPRYAKQLAIIASSSKDATNYSKERMIREVLKRKLNIK